jgi:Flp pilus assembly protein TadG
MRWLNRKLRSERGASAVMIGILLVPLLGFVAIAVDVGALYAERAQLQNGADAAALAIARDCQDGVCTDPAGAAARFTNDNANDGAANVLAPIINMADKTVTVSDSTRVAGTNAGAISHPFARFIGVDSTTVGATATAQWGSPKSGPVLALALSWCEFQESLAASGNHVTIRTDTNKTCKHAPSEEVIPGGFGWLDDADACVAIINLGLNLDADGQLWVGSDAGGDVSKDCKTELESLKGTTVLVPIYDRVRGTGTNAEYHIFAFAGFTITGWNFPSTKVLDPLAPLCPPAAPAAPKGPKEPKAPKPCDESDKSNNWNGIQGFFKEWVSVDGAFGLGGPELNAKFVKLIK